MVTLILLIFISYFDIRKRRIPVFLIGVGGAYWIVQQIFIFLEEKTFQSFSSFNVISALVIAGIFVFIKSMHPEQIGSGDILLLSLFSLLEGYPFFIVSLVFTFGIFIFFSVFLLFLGYSKKTALPFAPFLLLGHGTVLLFHFL